MPVAPKRNLQATRERILEAAKSLLTEGDGAFEMSWVAKSAGVSQGLAYHHFGSKEGLLSAVVNDFYDRVEAAVLMARLDEIEDWEEREQERTKRYIEFLVADPLALKIITRLAATPAVAGEEIKRWQNLIETGARNMAEGQASGAIPNQTNPKILAAMTLGAVRSALVAELTSATPDSPAQMAETIWRFVRGGLGLGLSQSQSQEDHL